MEQYKCMGFKRKFSWRRALPPGDVRDAFAAYAAGAAHMGADQLRRFLHEEQGESAATLGDAERTAAELLSRRSQTSAPGIDLDSFFYFLMSPDLNPCIGHQVHQDMSSPLSHYYIFTGHNSYLTGNQLSSDCSDIPIIQALQRGVRVIELDMWPNSTKDNVDILHGRTLTSPVDMIKCLRAIKEFAFCASPYPVVITLEDHLTPDLQAKVAEMILQTFGDLLYYPSSDSLEEFPSPESLKNRVIISTKPPKEYLESKNCNDREDSPHKGSKGSNWEDSPHKGSKGSNWEDSPHKGSKGSNLEDSPHKGSKGSNLEDSPHKGSKGSNLEDSPHKGSKGSNYGGERNDVADIKALCISNDKNGQDEEESDDDNEDDDELGVQQNSGPEYRSIITIHAGKPKGRLSHALKVDPFKARRLSLSEEQLQKLAESNGPDLVRFTQKNILRIYPKGTRITSSNYNPLLGWIHGAQMVAFNMQGHGKPLWLMQGLFRANGGCGYVRKPDFLLENGPNGEVFNPEASSPVKTTLKVRVYMGDGWNMDFEQTYFDTYSPPDFYTKLKIVGVPADSRKRKTKIIKDDWIPLWEEEFSFPLTVPEVALLRVEVREHDVSGKDDFGGQTCLPVRELKRGIRAVPLHDHKGNKYNSVRLLMRFQFT